MNISHLIGSIIALGCLAADDLCASDAPDRETNQPVAQALQRAVPILENAARNYPTHRKCFACHHQTLPLLGLEEARQSGIKINQQAPGEIAAFASDSFRSKIDDLQAGENIGGRGLTIGYALWTMSLAGTKHNDLSDAMVAYLLKIREPDGHWALHGIRPPAEESLVFCTVAAAAGLKAYARHAHELEATAAIDQAKVWLASAKLESQEDKLARLWGCRLLGSSDEELITARRLVLESQRPDGGWGQTAEMDSDPYATGSTLYVLLDTGLAPRDPAIARAMAFLLKSQQTDGSWFVETRAKPVQVFFDNGDPHGKNQFISIAATGWSVAALARAVRVKSQ